MLLTVPTGGNTATGGVVVVGATVVGGRVTGGSVLVTTAGGAVVGISF